MANALNNFGSRDKFLKSQYDVILRNTLVAEKICSVDRSDLNRIQSPYGSQPTAAVAAVASSGNVYALTDWSVSDDALTVGYMISYAEHIYANDQFFATFDITASRLDNMMYAVAFGIDKYVLNVLCADGTSTYTTPAGGFTTASNVNLIMANLASKVAGYQDVSNGTFLVIENTDLVGFAVAGATSGFSMADSTLKNGFMNSWMGVDIYVVRSGTFVTATFGRSFTNSGKRVFGVKGVATYATPRGINYEEKAVTLKTGKEIAVYAYIGAKVWTTKAALICPITLA